jgi:hypothetical protein
MSWGRVGRLVHFALGTNFSTEIAGSGNSYVIGEHLGIGPFKAAITEGSLLAAIKAANTKHGTGFSENLGEYAVIGVEQGTEENDSTAELNATGAATGSTNIHDAADEGHDRCV